MVSFGHFHRKFPSKQKPTQTKLKINHKTHLTPTNNISVRIFPTQLRQRGICDSSIHHMRDFHISISYQSSIHIGELHTYRFHTLKFLKPSKLAFFFLIFFLPSHLNKENPRQRRESNQNWLLLSTIAIASLSPKMRNSLILEDHVWSYPHFGLNFFFLHISPSTSFYMKINLSYFYFSI